ncbi:MAG TPA: NAD(P)H-hydrate dehydratase, partial [Pseudohaliea sp.]|nr:NAD(P)H-hydrate dehydratase [Pseudohaliea sp.]
MPERASYLYSAAQTRTLDAAALAQGGLRGMTLMGRAAEAAFARLARRWPEPAAIAVVCGGGNNGGDGYLIAALAHKRGLPVSVFTVGDPARLRGDAASARELALAEGVAVAPWRPGCLPDAPGAVLVDALLGTGLGGAVRPDAAAVIEAVNGSGLPVLAVDIPSGLCADTGRVLGAAVRATATVTFIGRKRGLYTADGPGCCGDIEFDDLAVPPSTYAAVPRGEAWEPLTLPAARAALAPRAPQAHKGHFGNVLVVGGDHGMGGAALLAAEAALRAGAGLVRVATRAEHVPALLARLPEAMATAVPDVHALEPLLAASDVLVLGPGLGRGPWGEQLFARAREAALPTVIDADGLALLAAGGEPWPAPAVLTPHPGEAGRLLGSDSAAVQADRFARARELADRYRATVVLKGNGSLVAGEDGSAGLCAAGNPGMATGGMGDVLAGLTGALLAQGLTPVRAARLAVCAHAAAADFAAA